MAFGMFVFSMPTLLYEQLQRRTDFRYGRTPRVGARDASQFIGPGDQTISLSGSTHFELGDGEVSLDELHGMAAEGEAQPLVCSNGRVYGNFVITGLDERHRLFATDGTPLAIDFAIDLLRVDDDAEDNATADAEAASLSGAAATVGEVASSSGLTATVGKITDLAGSVTARINQVNVMMERLSPQIGAMTRTLDMLGIVDARALSGIRETITALGRGAAASSAQAQALLNLGLGAGGVAAGMATNPSATVNDVLGRISALPHSQQGTVISGLFGQGNAATIGALVQNYDRLQQELGA